MDENRSLGTDTWSADGRVIIIKTPSPDRLNRNVTQTIKHVS